MRCKIGHTIQVFNESYGEYEAKILNFEKKCFVLKLLRKSKRYEDKFILSLLFAPVKKDKTEYIIQKATELGVSEFFPVLTQRTNIRSINLNRMNLIAKEASEQSERLSIPKINELKNLIDVISDWDNKINILYADETLKDKIDIKEKKVKLNSNGAVLIGPEGGFSKNEISFLKSKKFVIPISLGSRVLRSDTAIVVALSYWHFLNC